MQRILGYLKTKKTQAILAPLFKMLEAAFELAIPVLVARMIDIGIPGADRGFLLRTGALMVALGVVGFACSVTAQYFAAQAAVTCGTAMRSDLFAHIQSFSYTEIDRAGTATLITRMTSDINQVQNGVNMFLRLFLRSPFVVAGAAIMAFVVGGRTALIIAAVIALLALIVWFILQKTMPMYRRVQNKLDAVLRRTRENLLGVRVVRAFNAQDRERQAFDAENREVLSNQIAVGRISALLNPLTFVVVNLGIIALLTLGGRCVQAGTLSTGQVVALVNYLSQILVELIKLANLIILLSRAFASLSRVSAVFDTGISMQNGVETLSPSLATCVEFDRVSFTYADAAKPALCDISFTAKQGETIGIIGATGSGKTTLVNLIPRFYDATEGAVRVGGADVRSYSEESLHGQVGLVPQSAALFSGTLRENLRWGDPDATDEKMRRALKLSQALSFVDEKGEGLNLVIAQEGRNLSGGQRQRLTIARALVRNPRILILDDSSSALDMETETRLRTALHQSSADRITFVVSQRVQSVLDADRILVLHEGELAGSGTHEELLADCELYRELCASQEIFAEGSA